MEGRSGKAEVLEKQEPQEESPGVIINVSAPGKVILHGDHSVVYGRLAVAASLGLRTTLKITETLSPCLKISLQCRDIGLTIDFNIAEIVDAIAAVGIPLLPGCPNYDFEHPEYIDQERLLQQIESFLADKRLGDPIKKVSVVTVLYLYAAILLPAKVPLRSVELQAQTELQVGAGMGSSASFAVVLVCGLLGYIKRKYKTNPKLKVDCFKLLEAQDCDTLSERERQLISLWAYHAEKITHGNPSGIDNSTCTFGSVVEFRKGTDPRPLRLQNKLRALLIDTKVSRNTKALVEKVAKLKSRHPRIVEHTLDSMEAVAQKAVHCLQKLSSLCCAPNEVSQASIYYSILQELADMNQNMLRILGVSHPSIERICSVLHDNDLRGKLTGAGGGGYVLALIPPSVTQEALGRVTKTLGDEDFGFHVLELGGDGVKIH